MTSFEVERLRLEPEAVRIWARGDSRRSNWPVVYTLDGKRSIYVGESRNGAARLRQHLADATKSELDSVRVVFDGTFNKSAALDLESFLIRYLAGDGKFKVLNRNEGITNANYYDRDEYQKRFEAIFEGLRSDGVFSHTIPEIVNSDLFKFSPFKALDQDQGIAVANIIDWLLDDLRSGTDSTTVIEGEPGTGKTIVAIYLMKLIRDIARTQADDDVSGESIFSDFFMAGNRELFQDLRIALVVPQQSLRASIRKVFAKTPGLEASMVLTPFQVGSSAEPFDLLIVDETHRLNQQANQASGPLNKQFVTITEALFGADSPDITQLDWIRSRSKHQIFLLDAAQSVRPADLPRTKVESLVAEATRAGRRHGLLSQLRVRAGADYIEYIRRILDADPPEPIAPTAFGDYDFRLFDSVDEMHSEIRVRDEEVGLGRLVAGYAWRWQSKKDPIAYDIEIGLRPLRWNRTQRDWINSRGAIDEVGSIHTVQGYDLNYAGVIIGPDLRFDPYRNRLYADRANYFDIKGKENNPSRGIVYDDDDLLEFITNIYGVLLTRGIRGTYVYVCDPALREYLQRFIP